MSSVVLGLVFAARIFVMDSPCRGFDIRKAIGFAKVYSISNNIDHVSKVIQLRAVPQGSDGLYWKALYVMTTNNCSYCGVDISQDGSIKNERYFKATFTRTPSLTLEKVINHCGKHFGEGCGISYVKYDSFVKDEPFWLVYSTNGVYKLYDDYRTNEVRYAEQNSAELNEWCAK